ncbi:MULTISPECIES: 5-formyltetrahydrofolate cyclo-ligase [unclassified Pseudodesulfovibrio]|uniref:5-formyltetrahydrofolate cyclo-ligase n=1 Tax=unclassified Pseudodesulfovibrio TaxID=2661612 RepID=UPI000FEBB15E|nr:MULTISPECIES: 5-formyltetrahydrofolate cyclo-ligase [unclassified Pseudodesulfovibrio]MCJ2165720.1 5-formyltetrahydrofolate cyclo-ligase [Pseudodesulfovibrio sp. S3-i]RWU02908.1 5-formyltetrahydrofolate cyclo-ligase [Pseudodesulfovibrio sp. S3]
MTAVDKKKLRMTLLDARERLSPDAVTESSSMIIELIRTLFEWKNATTALLYWPIKGEVDLRPLATELWQRDCCVLLPRCRPGADGEMDLACAACEDELVPGPFSIMEPDAQKCPPVHECRPVIALIPGVGFDRKGNRLGFGGGYYDRLLASEKMRDTLKVGVAYDFQLVEHLPTQPWDQPMDVVCTEKELWRP